MDLLAQRFQYLVESPFPTNKASSVLVSTSFAKRFKFLPILLVKYGKFRNFKVLPQIFYWVKVWTLTRSLLRFCRSAFPQHNTARPMFHCREWPCSVSFPPYRRNKVDLKMNITYHFKSYLCTSLCFLSHYSLYLFYFTYTLTNTVCLYIFILHLYCKYV